MKSAMTESSRPVLCEWKRWAVTDSSRTDFNILEDGDQTEIGAKGVS